MTGVQASPASDWRLHQVGGGGGIGDHYSLNTFRILFGNSDRHMATHRVAHQDSVPHAEGIQCVSHRFGLPVDAVLRGVTRGLGPTVPDEIDGDHPLAGQSRGDAVPPLDRRRVAVEQHNRAVTRTGRTP